MISFLDGSTTVLTEEEMSRIDKASQGMANLLRMYCQRQDRQCRFEEDRFESHCGILWRLRCYVDEELAGVGMRTSKRMARNVAAWEACKRFELTVSDACFFPIPVVCFPPRRSALGLETPFHTLGGGETLADVIRRTKRRLLLRLPQRKRPN